MAKRTEEFKISGDDIMSKLKEVVRAGNVRKITVKEKSGKVIAEFPLTVGVVGALLAPVLAAIGTIVALATDCVIAVERET
jgi:aryl-alcohol dehydrogenase-like predicted oxidoreductase